MAAATLPSETPQTAAEREENPLLREFVINDFSTIRDENLSSSPSKASSFIPSRLLNVENAVGPPLRRQRTKLCKLTKRGKTCSRFVDAVRIPKLPAFPQIYELNPLQASRPVPVTRSNLQFTRPKKHAIIVEPAKLDEIYRRVDVEEEQSEIVDYQESYALTAPQRDMV
ncbi:hypothetical protein PRIPAC_95808 [Pristionchus pacificus]|uniref:Uncharacterized protein n=1 Tax=Pristionchus pacificus TaxID=54126 RepID=A0A2A6D1S0_PRIPA|nr:hypothetical protein PRIPAC_95808 [Pristionchus pacificus]|eukprot:PDM84432.1 hypothetical protein PRIPAC_33455 [Pristionchus pacificus]